MDSPFEHGIQVGLLRVVVNKIHRNVSATESHTAAEENAASSGLILIDVKSVPAKTKFSNNNSKRGYSWPSFKSPITEKDMVQYIMCTIRRGTLFSLGVGTEEFGVLEE